jgi:SecD/SecF fusion protein
MLALPRWKIFVCLLAVLFGLAFTAPNLIPQKTLDSLPGWLPKSKLNLGLDLQGGSYLLLEVDTDALKAEKLNNLLEDARTTLAGKSLATTALGLNNGVVSVHLADPNQSNAAYQALNQLGQLQTDGARDVVAQNAGGGVINLSLSDRAMAEESSKAVDQSIEIIRRRVDALGTREPSITRQGLNRIVVEAPGESDPEKLKAVIGQTAKLTFQMVDDQVSPDDLQAGRIPPDDVQLPTEDQNGQPLVVKRRSVVTGEMLTDATQGFDQQSGAADVNFRFNSVGAQRFGAVTAQNIGKRFAIVLDNKIVSAPVIQGAIAGGSGQITGNFTPESANQLAIVLRSGALPAKLNPIEQRSVGAELGADAVRAGQISAVLGFVVILVFIVLAYGLLFGGIAVAALAVNGLLLIAAMSLTQATLTLPGVAGMILSLALAVDASVLIYERIRDEARAGRTPVLAAEHGFSRALISIMDANVTTLIAGAIMFQFGAGPVRGFAWSLSIGVFTSVFSAVVISQVLLGVWFRRTRPKSLPIIDKDGRKGWPLIKWVPAQTHFKFTRLAPIAAVISGLLVLGSFGALGTIGLNLGTDFAGGTVIEVATPGVAPLSQFRAELSRDGVHDASVQGFGAANAALLRFKTPDGQDAMQAANGVRQDLTKAFPGVQITRVEVVGPKVSGELMTSGLLALGLAIGLMLVYIWFRFQLQFGLGAVIAIFHDLILTVGMLAVLHIEFSMTSIAALLTIIGYSMNEKVITFDRLRENLRKYKRTTLREIIDLSENERLSRTLITGSTALLALAGMLFMGGPALFPLVFAMVFGIFVGTYSSIYVALPIILVWGVKRGDEAEPAPGAKAALSRP